MTDSFKSPVASDYFVMVLNAVLAFFLIPAYMIGYSPQDYAFLDSNLLFLSACALSAAAVAFQSMLYCVANALKRRNLASKSVRFICIWICLSGFLLPISSSAGMVDAISIPTNLLNLTIVTSLSIIMTYILTTKLAKFVAIFLVVFLGVTIFSIAPAIYNTQLSSGSQGISDLSKEKNIIVLSFDGLPGRIAYQHIEEDRSLQNAFKDFAIFENVVGTSAATNASLTGELFGNRDFKKISKTQRGLYSNLDKSDLLINQEGYDSYTFGEYNHFNLNNSTEVALGNLSTTKPLASRIDNAIMFFRYAGVRIASNRAIRAMDYMKSKLLPNQQLSAYFGDTAEKDRNDLALRLKTHTGPVWDRINVMSLHDYDDLLHDLSANKKGTCIRFMHFTFTHYPVDFDEFGTYRSDDYTWYHDNQNEKGVFNETKFAIKKLAEFIHKLKKLDIYDQSLVVLKSDHGKPAFYYNTSPHNLRINGNKHWGHDRYRPMLMIKGYDTTRTESETVKEIVLLDDLARTLWEEAEGTIDSDKFPGINLLAKDRTTSNPFFIYVPESANSDWQFDTHMPVSLTRGKSLIDSMRDSPEISLDSAE